MHKKDLMLLDFESILKYFRVTLPKKCRNEETARQLMKMACSIKVKRLKKYEQEYLALKGTFSYVYSPFMSIAIFYSLFVNSTFLN